MLLALRSAAVLVAATLVVAACGEDGTPTSSGGELPQVVVTTNILGDVVGDLVGDQAEVATIMPVGANPHDFQASARQANEMREADALVLNGAGFEEGLSDLIEATEADGVPTYEAISGTDTISFGAAEEAHDHAGEDDHGHAGTDPHFFTDPGRMAEAVEGIADFLTDNVAALDNEEFAARAAATVAELRDLETELEQTLSEIPEEDRVLVTNHEVFGYFADRYDFEVIGTVIPAGSTNEAASGGDLNRLAEVIREEGVPAIFAETSSPDLLASTLADEIGEIAVVELFAESLGGQGSGGETYVEMMRTNARRIVDALT